MTNLCTVGENTLALEFILTILFKNLDKLTGTSDQYIGLFSNALENFAQRVTTNPELGKVLDSDAVLSAVIARITYENTQAAELRNSAKESS
jgi:hydrogenase maturation factor HypF (carbamoyltransferase family)